MLNLRSYIILCYLNRKSTAEEDEIARFLNLGILKKRNINIQKEIELLKLQNFIAVKFNTDICVSPYSFTQTISYEISPLGKAAVPHYVLDLIIRIIPIIVSVLAFTRTL